ncbi:MAG: T9SS type A sorting domain-containing protein [Candidatus Eisenbacteria bacterium]
MRRALVRGSRVSEAPGTHPKIHLGPLDAHAHDYTVRFAITGTARRAAGMPPVLVLRSPSPSPEIRYEPLPGTTTQVRVLAVDGREVASREWLGGREHRLFLSGLPNGIYFVRLAQGRDVIATKRAVVLR